ncbi:MAG: hypothetical protein HQM12_10625 [SAR324 cluster bacterium]|nr:hypothetical protein [SAR324 cluster bacterium]
MNVIRNDLLQWSVEKNPDNTVIYLKGIINEEFTYKELLSEIQERRHLPLRIHLKEIKRINSMGIREWFNLLRDLHWETKVVLSECSMIFTEVLSQIEELGYGCFIESCYVPVWCDHCEEEFEIRINMTIPLSENPADIACPLCGDSCSVDTWSLEDILKKQKS